MLLVCCSAIEKGEKIIVNICKIRLICFKYFKILNIFQIYLIRTYKVIPKTAFKSYWEKIRLQFTIGSRITQSAIGADLRMTFSETYDLFSSSGYFISWGFEGADYVQQRQMQSLLYRPE